tara:strand:+ start:1646 stop:2146 length:501 start_codon:yes stop_codon:yes gene_type:complete
MDSCFYSSIVFLILALVLDNFILKILFLLLCITSSIFHLYDHEIYPQREIYNIYYYDMLSILCIALYIITNNITYSIVLTLIIIILFKKINRFSVCSYLIGLLKIVYYLCNKYNNILILTIVIVAFISFYDNNIKYTLYPYHISWKPANALIWHTCNASLLYLYLQ